MRFDQSEGRVRTASSRVGNPRHVGLIPFDVSPYPLLHVPAGQLSGRRCTQRPGPDSSWSSCGITDRPTAWPTSKLTVIPRGQQQRGSEGHVPLGAGRWQHCKYDRLGFLFPYVRPLRCQGVPLCPPRLRGRGGDCFSSLSMEEDA